MVKLIRGSENAVLPMKILQSLKGKNCIIFQRERYGNVVMNVVQNGKITTIEITTAHCRKNNDNYIYPVL